MMLHSVASSYIPSGRQLLAGVPQYRQSIRLGCNRLNVKRGHANACQVPGKVSGALLVSSSVRVVTLVDR